MTIRWYHLDELETDDMHEQIEQMAQANGTHEDTVFKIQEGTAKCVITKYMGEADNDWITRVMAPVMSQASEYNHDIDPETGNKYGWQSVGEFLTYHANQEGEYRFNAVCLTRLADEGAEKSRRSQRMDRIERVLAYVDLNWFPRLGFKAGSKTIQNRIANKEVI